MSFSAKDPSLDEAIICLSGKEGRWPVFIEIKDDDECSETYRAEIIALANKIPGFNGFTGFKIGIFTSDLLLPMNEFVNLYHKIVQNYYNEAYKIPEQYKNFTHGLPKTKLFVSLKESLTPT